MEISTVSVFYVNSMLRSLTQRGHDASDLLKRIGINTEVLDNEKARVRTEQFVALSEKAIELLQDENTGYLETPTRPGTFAMMCYASIHRPTLGLFLQRGIDFYHTISDSYLLELEPDGDYINYVLTLKSNASDPDNILPLTLLSVIHRLSCWIIGQSLSLKSVNFSHSRPQNAKDYNLLFKAPILFDQPRNSLRFSSKQLELPNRQSEQNLEEFLTLPSLALMSLPDYENSLVDKIRMMIQQNVADHFPEFDAIAEKLQLTSATLRRRLRTEGTSYQNIKDDIRRDTAIYLLSSGTKSIEQVAEDVGFTEPTSFYRAFKRWTGVTPRDYIKKQPEL